MRILLLLLLLVFSKDKVRAQVENDSVALVESITAIRKSTEADTIKANKLLALFHTYKNSEPRLALKAAEAAYLFSTENNLEYYKASALRCMGIANYSMDRYAEALAHFLQALPFYERLGLKAEQRNILRNMGNIFLYQELPEQAFPYYNRALAIDKELQSDLDIAKDLMNISSAYSVTPEFDPLYYVKLDSAFLLCSQALQKGVELKDTFLYSQCLGNLGMIEFQQKKYDIALKHILEAEKLFREHGIEDNLGVLFLSLGDIYIDINNVVKATEYYSKALENARSMESIDDERLAYRGLSTCAELEGNTVKAYDYFKKYSALNDSIFNIKSSRKQTQLLMNYEMEKKEVLVKAEQEKMEAIHTAEVDRQRSQKNIFIAGFVIVFILSFIMLRLYRLKNKSNKKLSEALERLERTQTQLIHQEKMASLGMLTAGIAHEIQNPLNFVTNFSETSLELMKEMNATGDEKEKRNWQNSLP